MVQKNQAVCGFLEQSALSGLSCEACVPCYIAYQFQEGLQQDHNSAGNSEITKKNPFILQTGMLNLDKTWADMGKLKSNDVCYRSATSRTKDRLHIVSLKVPFSTTPSLCTHIGSFAQEYLIPVRKQRQVDLRFWAARATARPCCLKQTSRKLFPANA